MADFVQKTIETLDRPAPQVGMSGVVAYLGFTLQDLIGYLTVIYFLLMIAWYVRKHLRGVDGS